jgi:hypothetical protein
MKKWLLLIAAVAVLFFACIYILIPADIEISYFTTAKATRDGTYRTIASENEWMKWWNYNNLQKKPSEINNRIFSNENYTYAFKQSGFNTALISIQHENNKTDGKLTILQLAPDSIVITLQTSLKTTANPFSRIQQYFEAVSLKENIEKVLASLKAFVEKDENIYGIKISETTTRDSFLISKKQMFAHQPSMTDVYALINDLKEYASKNNCKQVSSPMLNILEDSNKYRVMVALPINKAITTQPPVSLIKMTNGNFMTTRVQGGLMTVQKALQQMQLYFDDYDKTSMAITFQYLVTDRTKEADTTKWITEIYAPVL